MTPSDLITSRLLPALSALAEHLSASRSLTREMFEPANLLQWEEIVAAERSMRRLACDALDALRFALFQRGSVGQVMAGVQMTLVRVGATESEIRRWAGEWKERAREWEAEEEAEKERRHAEAGAESMFA